MHKNTVKWVFPIVFAIIASVYLFVFYRIFGILDQLGFFYLPVVIIVAITVMQWKIPNTTALIFVKGLVGLFFVMLWGNTFSPVVGGRVVPLWAWFISVFSLFFIAYWEYVVETREK